MILSLVSVAFCVWVIFLGGADRLESTVLGYLYFMSGGDQAQSIKILAAVVLFFNVSHILRQVIE